MPYRFRMPLIAEGAYSAIKAFSKEIYLVTLHELERTLILLKEFPSLDSRYAIHAATMLKNNVEKILSTDPHFDIVNGIKRIAQEML